MQEKKKGREKRERRIIAPFRITVHSSGVLLNTETSIEREPAKLDLERPNPLPYHRSRADTAPDR